MESIGIYKNRAIESLNGNWKKGALATLIYVIILCAPTVTLNFIFAPISIGAFWGLVLLPLSWGFWVLFLSMAHGEQVEIGQMFDCFKDYKRLWTTLFLQGLYTWLWSLLLLIPGIIKQYSYAMTVFVLKDNPDMKNNEAIEKSMELMDGHKMKLFLLDLSMIGWYILSICTLGIGLFFLIPYIYTAHAHFYEDLKKENAEFDSAMENLGLR